MKKVRNINNYIFFSGILFVFFVWYIASIIANSEAKVPSINSVVLSIYELSTNKSTYLMIYGTFSRSILGFSISLVAALIIGSLANFSQKLKFFLKPIVTSLRAIPTASIILFLLIVVGFKLSTYYLVFIMCFPILYQSVVYGVENIDKELLMINKIDNCDNVKNFFYFLLPLSLPSIINGILMSFALAIKTEVMGEILSGSTSVKGLGIMLNYYKNNLQTNYLFAVTIIIIGITTLIEISFKFLNKLIKT